MTEQEMPRWKNFTEWRSEADPEKKLTSKDCVSAYERWKENWRHDVADIELKRQAAQDQSR